MMADLCTARSTMQAETERVSAQITIEGANSQTSPVRHPITPPWSLAPESGLFAVLDQPREVL